MTDTDTTTGMKRLITLQITVEVDEDSASYLVGDPGWSSHDGWEPPATGLEILSHTACDALTSVAEQSLSAVKGRAIHTGITISDPYDTDTDELM